MSRRGIVNVRMVVTEEKILSNIDKVQKLINPNSKKKIVQLQDDSDFKDLIESIKTYLIEYPKKKNFPVKVYKATYGLVEFATIQFEENTKKVEKLIKQREENIALSGILRNAINAVENKEPDWKEQIVEISDKFPEDVIKNLNMIAACKGKTSQTYLDTMKLLKARVNNLESNLHIEIDMDRLEDSSKALSYIGIEVAEALKLIPTPEEQLEAIEEENKAKAVQNVKETPIEKIKEEKEKYIEETTFEAKPSLWQKIKNSKIIRAATYIFRIRVRIELPSKALPEGNNDNV